MSESGPPEVPSGEAWRDAQEAFFAAANRSLDQQLTHRDRLITRSASMLGIGAAVLPIVASFTLEDASSVSGGEYGLLALAIGAFVALVVCAGMVSRPALLELGPDVELIGEQINAGNYRSVRLGIATRTSTSVAANREKLERCNGWYLRALLCLGTQALALVLLASWSSITQ